MDYLDLTADEAKEIDKIFAKDENERTEEEKITIAEYNMAWETWDKYNAQLIEERAKNRAITIKYHELLSEESQAKFDEIIKGILDNEYTLEDD